MKSRLKLSLGIVTTYNLDLFRHGNGIWYDRIQIDSKGETVGGEVHGGQGGQATLIIKEIVVSVVNS